MITLKDLKALKDNDGLTLRHGDIIRHKTGYQVADIGIETTSAREALKAIYRMHGNAGVWYSKGVYYIDHSFRITTLSAALKVGRKHNQQSIYDWTKNALIWC